MSTSGISTGTMTAEEVVQAAMEELGVLSAGERVTGDELLTGLRSLNWMLKSFTARGINQWRQHTTTVTFPAGQSAITLPPIIEEVTYAAVKAGAHYARPLTRYQSGQYPQVGAQSRGAPVSYYVDRQRDACRMTLWPSPIADTDIVIDVLRVIDDVTAGDQTVDVPQKWLETVYIALAARLATVMGVTRTDPGTAATLAQRAQAFEQLLLDDDRPASLFMGDYGGSFGVGGGIYAPLPTPTSDDITVPPSFTSNPTISSDGTPQVGEQLIGFDASTANLGLATVSRSWLSGSEVLSTSSTYTPTAAGALTFRNQISLGGLVIASVSASVTVAAAASSYLMDFRVRKNAAYTGAFL